MNTMKLCRLCLTDENYPNIEIINIFKTNNSLKLPQIIFKCTAIKITINDTIPSNICSNCVEMIQKFDKFINMCQHSEMVLSKKYRKKCVPEFMLRTQKKFNNNKTKDNNQIKENNENIYLNYKLKKVKLKTDSFDKNAINYCNAVESDKDSQKLQLNNNESGFEDVQNDYFILHDGERKIKIYKIDDNMKTLIGNNIYTCSICSQEFTTFFEYHDHQEVHNGQPVFKCNKCSEVFSKRMELVGHDRNHKISCEICSLQVLPKSMAAHTLIHTDIHKCPECGMRHTSHASLEKHIKARHIGIKGYLCHICGKQSSCQSSMTRHMGYHNSERPFKCKYCDFSAKSVSIIQVHTTRQHFAEKTICEICAKIFKSQLSLIQHMKRIHSERKYVCKICGKLFIERYNLKQHNMKRHAIQRLHECKVCHKELFTVRQLKQHKHTHRQGCVNCPKCGKEFYYKKYYDKHIEKCVVNIG